MKEPPFNRLSLVLDKKTRIRLVMAVKDRLAGPGLSWADVNLILETYGVGTYTPDDPWGSNDFLDVVKAATDEQLVEIADFLELDSVEIPVPMPKSHVPTVNNARPLFIFASHLTAHRLLVGAVKDYLAKFGMELFVAHDSIDEGQLWQQQIEEGLDRADLGLVFVHEGLGDSAWCDQEIGWLQGRKVPVISLGFDHMPYGFFAKQQALKVFAGATPAQIGDMVVDRIATRPELALGFAASLVSAMGKSNTFADTNDIWLHLKKLTLLDADLCARLLEATKTNNQIYWAYSKSDGRQPFDRLIVDFLRRQPGVAVVAPDIDAYENYLDEQDAESEARANEVRQRLEAEKARIAGASSDPFG